MVRVGWIWIGFLTCLTWMMHAFFPDMKASDKARSDASADMSWGSWLLLEISPRWSWWSREILGWYLHVLGNPSGLGILVASRILIQGPASGLSRQRLGISILAEGPKCVLVPIPSDAPQFLEAFVLYDAEGIYNQACSWSLAVIVFPFLRKWGYGLRSCAHVMSIRAFIMGAPLVSH